ncbi:alpha-galactosidase [Dorea longicatena]|uniref:alpha-galactosidase n=1 Tax=Dorea longicatena TaxID=88431 RepID=UPI001D007101|nr:alpha-galactosidase [Dorea longicatena]MCB5535599.1 alpha-galactosidase [bacterium MSK17_88]MCB5546345.1 alpha-galactosidase [Dorea longicatena]MCG4573911.1 alpha-galactosidase [Dorea longicatena]
MGIVYSKSDRTFTIQTKNTTYQMQVDPYGFLLHLYYGKKTDGSCMDYLLTYYDRGFSGNPFDAGDDRTYSMDALPQEYPSYGTGDYRSTALIVENADGSTACDLRYRSHHIFNGKYKIPGLPAVYADETESQTLEIVMEDAVTGVEVTLQYGVLPDYDVITRSEKIVYRSEGKICIRKAQSACLDFVQGKYDLLTFYGRHAMERTMQRESVTHGSHVIGSVRGTSSHQYNPMMILADENTTDQYGNCYAMSFVYSGNFKGETLKDQFGQTRALMGLQDEMFSYPLAEGETFYTPEVLLTFSGSGMNLLSQNLHRCIRQHICRGKYKESVRPVLVNSWEASYFDFDGDTLYELAKEAKHAGIDMLVLDDGWFGKRDDDNSGLGDWFVNEKKLGGTLGDLIKKINDLGVKFGIWVEPEMISEDSDLYREHPDWALTIPGRNPVHARNQLVLDFSRKEVVDHIFDQICKVLDQGNIEYVKWDMNRSLMDVFSRGTEDQGRVMYDYVLGLYDFLERIVTRYPDLLIEGCSGGGGRFDAGMMYYTPQIWCSDNTDALDRLQIQYGTSFGYPVSAVGSHVSAVPNHQTGRITSLHTRGVVAMAGTFGYELNLGKLSEEEKQEIRLQVEEYRKFAPLIQTGLYYRLSDPAREEYAAWAFVSEDQKEVLLNVVLQEIHGNMTVNYVKLQGLKCSAIYRDTETGKIYNGAALMEAGIPMPVEMGEFKAYQMHLEAEE